MVFCPKCGSILKYHREGNTTKASCSCGYSSVVEGKTELSDKPKQEEIRVIEEDSSRLAVYDHKCPKCGYGKAQMIEKGIQYSDEDDLVLYKCGKCGHVHMMEAKIQ